MAELQYACDLAYVGTNYLGWQSQRNGRTVQEAVVKAFNTFLRTEISIVGSSRTDTGVHALHQVISFKHSSEIESYRFVKAINALLPADISVRNLRLVPRDFHPILSATGKIYCYRIWRGDALNPFMRPYCWHLYGDLNEGLIDSQLQAFIGTHDFTSFCAADSTAKTKIRRIIDIQCHREGDLLEIWIAGEGFLKQMIRSMVGTVVDISRDKIRKSIPELLQIGDRTAAGRTAPAHGLMLMKVCYETVASIQSAMKDGCFHSGGVGGIVC